MSKINQAEWIEAARYGTQMPVFGKDIYLEERPVRAEIEICGLGQFALFIGDKEINEGAYEPGWTDYGKTCLYSTYDVTESMRQGENRIRVMTGNGMYHVEGGRYEKFKDSYGNPVVIAALSLHYANGREEIVTTDGSWSVCPGPVLFSCIYGGEDYDGGENRWKGQAVCLPAEEPPAEVPFWTGSLISGRKMGALKEASQPVVCTQAELEGRMIRELPGGRRLYDFGRNYAGMVRIRVKGEKEQTVKITPGELLCGDGSINQEFTGGPHYYVYTLAGEGGESWTPRFTYYGQRYAVIETSAQILSVSGREIYASCPQTGYFRCSNEMYNQIHGLIVGAVRSNMQSVFTDCPHREKLGWLEETHLIGPGILYNFDAKKLFEKILSDMEDSQTQDGLIPSICPEFVQFELGFRDSPEWGSAGVLLPWYLYERYGDKELLKKHYGLAKRYTEYLLGKSRGYIVNYGLGDWLDVGHYPMHPANTPIPITATAILYQDLCVMKRMAEVLGKKEDAAVYEGHAAGCREAFNEAFFYPLGKTYATGSQTANAMALYLDMVQEEYREEVLKNLVEDVRLKGGHFTGGDVGHPYMIRALGKCGRNDIIAENFMKTDFPSYGYQVVSGATTLCEDWDGPNPEHPVMSQNHFMLGAAEEWFYGYLAGMRVDASREIPIRIEPCFPAQTDWVECAALTPAGICKVCWHREADGISVEVELERKASVVLCLAGREEIVEVDGRVVRKV